MILRQEDKKELVKIAKKFLQKSVEIWAYGSRVDGTAHETSDLDLVLRSKDLKPIPTMELTDFELAVAESNIPILVQIFDWARIPESFHKNILNNYEILKPPNRTKPMKPSQLTLKNLRNSLLPKLISGKGKILI